MVPAHGRPMLAGALIAQSVEIRRGGLEKDSPPAVHRHQAGAFLRLVSRSTLGLAPYGFRSYLHVLCCERGLHAPRVLGHAMHALGLHVHGAKPFHGCRPHNASQPARGGVQHVYGVLTLVGGGRQLL